jgi:hypothetical protein
MRQSLRPTWAFCLTASLLLAGCTNLDAVREFGKSAAGIASYPDAAVAYEASVRTIQPFMVPNQVQPADRPEIRHDQVERAMQAQASLSAYFSMLASLAGEDAFSLAKQLDAIDKGLKAVPAASGDATDIDAAIALAKVVQKYLLAEKQAQAIKDLVHEGGPHAMRVLDSLLRTTASWRGTVANDRGLVSTGLGALAVARDTTPLTAMLANDRLAQIDSNYAGALKRIDTVRKGLEEVKQAHVQMAASVGQLTIKEWVALVRGAAGDLQLAKKNIEQLH